MGPASGSLQLQHCSFYVDRHPCSSTRRDTSDSRGRSCRDCQSGKLRATLSKPTIIPSSTRRTPSHRYQKRTSGSLYHHHVDKSKTSRRWFIQSPSTRFTCSRQRDIHLARSTTVRTTSVPTPRRREESPQGIVHVANEREHQEALG